MKIQATVNSCNRDKQLSHAPLIYAKIGRGGKFA
jgi:hypothetical protein